MYEEHFVTVTVFPPSHNKTKHQENICNLDVFKPTTSNNNRFVCALFDKETEDENRRKVRFDNIGSFRLW